MNNKISEYNRNYYIKNRERIIQKHLEYYHENKEMINQRNKDYYVNYYQLTSFADTSYNSRRCFCCHSYELS